MLNMVFYFIFKNNFKKVFYKIPQYEIILKTFNMCSCIQIKYFICAKPKL